MPQPNEGSDSVSGSLDTTNILSKLPDSQVFSRDPEQYTAENTADTIERLRKVVARIRKARADDAEMTTLTTKIKKANKTKARKTINILDEKI